VFFLVFLFSPSFDKKLIPVGALALPLEQCGHRLGAVTFCDVDKLT
jgi:hypothetical protein